MIFTLKCVPHQAGALLSWKLEAASEKLLSCIGEIWRVVLMRSKLTRRQWLEDVKQSLVKLRELEKCELRKAP